MRLPLCTVVSVCAFVFHAGHGREDVDNDRLPEHSQKGPTVSSKVKRSSREVVAFDVRYFGPEIKNHRNHPRRRVAYNKISLNIGGGYNLGLHAFIAPHAGLYKFDIHGLSGGAGIGCLELLHNGHWTATTTAHFIYSHMGITRLLELNKSDSVYVTMCGGTDNSICKWHKNTFAGFLIN